MPMHRAPVGSVDVQVFTENGTWLKPAGAKRVRVELIGGGASGQGGAYAAASASSAGGTSGGGSPLTSYEIDGNALPDTVAVTVGKGAAGGAGRTRAAGAGLGTVGTNGGETTFGAFLKCRGGGYSTMLQAGFPGASSAGTGDDFHPATGKGANQASEHRRVAPTGGGSGGEVTAANMVPAAQAGGTVGRLDSASFSGPATETPGGVAGTVGGNGGHGGNSPWGSSLRGGSGGGGGHGQRVSAVAAGNGGNGGFPGGGGGGGGAAQDVATAGGKGGDGGDGVAIITTYR